AVRAQRNRGTTDRLLAGGGRRRRARGQRACAAPDPDPPAGHRRRPLVEFVRPELEFAQPTSLADAVAIRAEHPGALPIQGGTDVMVELNFHRKSPALLLDLSRVAELRDWTIADDGRVRLGAGVTYARVIDELADRLPGLAIAARTVGSRQIRNAGT